MKKINIDALNYSPFNKDETVLLTDGETVYSREKTKEGDAEYYTYKVWKPFNSILFKLDPKNYDWMTNEEFVTIDSIFYRSCEWKQVGLPPNVPLNFPVLLAEDIQKLYSVFKLQDKEDIIPIDNKLYEILTPDIIPTKFLFKGDLLEEDKQYIHSAMLDGNEKPYIGTFYTDKIMQWKGACLGDCSTTVLFYTNEEDKWSQAFDADKNRKNPLSSDMSPLICNKCLEEEATKLFKELEEHGIGTITDGEFTLFNPPPPQDT